jgi:hypothetical protein
MADHTADQSIDIEDKYAAEIDGLQHDLATVKHDLATVKAELQSLRTGASPISPPALQSKAGVAPAAGSRTGYLSRHSAESNSADRALSFASFAIAVATFATAVVSLFAVVSYFRSWRTEGKLEVQLENAAMIAKQAALNSQAATDKLNDREREFRSVVSVGTSVHESLWYVSRGEQELFVHKNLDRARSLADRAERLLNAMPVGSESESFGKLGHPVRAAVWLLQGHCALHQPNGLSLVESNLERLRKLPLDDFRDVDLLDGVWRMHKASRELTDVALRMRLLKEAQDKLESGMANDRHGNKGLVYLSLAALDRRDFRLASESAKQFIDAFPTELERRARLGEEIQALLVVASCWEQLTLFLEDPHSNFKFAPLACNTDLASLADPDGRLCLTLLERIQAALESPSLNIETREVGLWYCGVVRSAVNLSMGSKGCTPRPGQAHDAQPAPAAYDAPPAPVDDAPPAPAKDAAPPRPAAERKA